mmetsp:Transcript_20961/g.35367  ORF Transcript_20961/g.35367 Transcript_20961/m.35367 type:complete len:148 (+) Transcript_20961:203-646(+)
MNADILGLIGSFSSATTNSTVNSIPVIKAPQPHVLPISPPTEKCLAFSIVIFSKDRPFQLHSLLQSIGLFFLDKPAMIFVIYTTSSDWEVHYEAVFEHAAETVIPILEKNFPQDVEDCFDRILDDPNVNFVMFCVDDLIFYDQISIR